MIFASPLRCPGGKARFTNSAHPMGSASFVGCELFFSNRILPTMQCKTNIQPHVGMRIVGTLETIKKPINKTTHIPIPSNAITSAI
jgi:hypothetical protein